MFTVVAVATVLFIKAHPLAISIPPLSILIAPP
jgi:hypothetical protein